MNNNIKPQKKEGWCGPTSLQYALKKQGVNTSQEYLVEMTGTTTKKGVDPGKLSEVARKYGMKVETVRNDNPLTTLVQINKFIDDGYSVIVDYLVGKDIKSDGHYAVVHKIEDGQIKLLDPQNAKITSFKLNRFVNKWKDTTIKGNQFNNWAMAIKKQ